MTRIINPHQSFQEVMRNHGASVTTGGETWYFLPFWITAAPDNYGNEMLVAVDFEKIPPRLMEAISKMRVEATSRIGGGRQTF